MKVTTVAEYRKLASASDLELTFAAQLRQHGIAGWVTEYRFHATRKWRFDFAWPALKVAVEVEGGTWSGGRHTRGKGFEDDCEKYSEAALAGWRVIRATEAMVSDERAIAMVERAVRP